MNDYYFLIVGGKPGVRRIKYNIFEAIMDSVLSNYTRYRIHIVAGNIKNTIDSFAKKFCEEYGYDFIELDTNSCIYHKYRKMDDIKNLLNMEHEYISKFDNRYCVIFLDKTLRSTLFNFAYCRKYNTEYIVFNIGDNEID